jgi:hypothetical protein
MLPGREDFEQNTEAPGIYFALMKNFSEQQLQSAVERAGLDRSIFLRVRSELSAQPETKPGFEVAHIAYYLGALLIIGAMGWFITDAWTSLSGATISLIALSYGLIFGGAGIALYRRPATLIPGGLLSAVAVCMTPLAVYGLERQIGWWPATNPGSYTQFHPMIDGSWVLMEAVTILVAATFLRFVRFPFITAPAAYALWFMSMDATALLLGRHWTFHQECWISVAFGVLMLALAYFADGETDKDFAFWFYLFGLMAFTGGLTLLGDGNQLGKAIYCLVHLFLIFLSIVLQRKAFIVFGAIGVFCYLEGEATGFFRNSFGFTLALTLIGVLFIIAGLLYKKNEAALTKYFDPIIPARVKHRHLVQLT